MNKLLLCSNFTPAEELAVSITPSGFSVETDNGKYKSPNFTANVFNGVGPFTYAWSADSLNSGVTVFNENSQTAYFEVSGFNDFESVTMFCTVTDTFNAEFKTTAANVAITFGEPL